MPPSPPIYGYEMAVEGTGMLMTGFFLLFCCCGVALFGGMTDRHRHISRMIGVKDQRVDLHTRAKNGQGQTWQDNMFARRSRVEDRRRGQHVQLFEPLGRTGRGAERDEGRGFVRVAL